MRVSGIDEQKSTEVLEEIQKELSKHIAAVERQLAALRERKEDYEQRLNDQRARLEAKLADLRQKLDRLETETGAYPYVVDWVSWLADFSSFNFRTEVVFQQVVRNLEGANSPAFAEYVRQTVEFAGDNARGAGITIETSVEGLINFLENFTPVVAANVPDNEREVVRQEQRARAQELLTALQEYKRTRIRAAQVLAQRFLEDQGSKPGKNLEETIENLEQVGTNEAVYLLQDIAQGLSEDVGQYGITFASQILQLMRNAKELRGAGVLTTDFQQRLINNEFTDAEINRITQNLVAAVDIFDQMPYLDAGAVSDALESLARLETANPAIVTLPQVADANLGDARENIGNALNQSKEIIALWQRFLPVPRSPSFGDVVRWVKNRGVGGDPDALEKARKLERQISETKASIRILFEGTGMNTDSLVNELTAIRNGFVTRYKNNQALIRATRENDRIVTIHELTEGESLVIPFKIFDSQEPVRVSWQVTAFDQHAQEVTDQLLFEALDYGEFPVNGQEERARLARENPDALAANDHVVRAGSGVVIRENDQEDNVAVADGINLAGDINKRPFEFFIDRVANYQTGTFTLQFKDDAPVPQTVIKQFKLVVYEKEPCARTGKRFVRLFNNYGRARWETAFTSYEKSLLFQRQVLGDPKPEEKADRHAGRKTAEIQDLLIKRRNYLGELDQYHIQEALRERDPSDPDFILARGNQIAIEKINQRLYEMGYKPEKEKKENPVEEKLRESWQRAGYKDSFRDYTDKLKRRRRGVWVGRCSHDPLPTPASFALPRRRPSEYASGSFLYETFAPRRTGERYKDEELWFMQAAQMVGLGAERYNYNWAQRKPEPPADPVKTIAYNREKLTFDCLDIDLNDPEYQKYLENSLVDYIRPEIQNRLPTFVPIASRPLKGFVSDSEDSEEESEEESAGSSERVSVGRELAPFESDTDSDDDFTPIDSSARKGKKEVEEGEENEFFPSFGLTEESSALLEDQEVLSSESPFLDKFPVSDEESEEESVDQEALEKIQEIGKNVSDMQERWQEINNQPLPDLDASTSDPKTIKEWVASLSKHSKMVRRSSREILSETVSALSQIDSLSEKFQE